MATEPIAAYLKCPSLGTVITIQRDELTQLSGLLAELPMIGEQANPDWFAADCLIYNAYCWSEVNPRSAPTIYFNPALFIVVAPIAQKMIRERKNSP